MICQRCLLRIRASYSAPSRVVSANSARANSSILSTPRRPPSPMTLEKPPAAQSFSNSPASLDPSPSASSSPEPIIVSSVAAGTPLKGLDYLKGKDPPLAQADHEYPGWLWGLLDEGKKSGNEDGGDSQGDSYSKSRKERRLAARAALKAAKSNPEALVPKVPLERQSIDLPVGDGTTQGAIAASRSREEVRDAMRKGRRKTIKEGNFLKAMR